MNLTKTEHLVYSLALSGISSLKELATKSGKTEKTIKYHLGNIYKKTNYKSLRDLCGLTNLVDPPSTSNYTWKPGYKCDCTLSSTYKTPEEVPKLESDFNHDDIADATPVPVTDDNLCAFCGYAAIYMED